MVADETPARSTASGQAHGDGQRTASGRPGTRNSTATSKPTHGQRTARNSKLYGHEQANARPADEEKKEGEGGLTP